MDLLQNSAHFYEKLTQSTYTFVLGSKSKKQYHFTIRAKSENFPHLVGLDKLKDITTIFQSKEKFSKKDGVLKRITEGSLKLEDLKKSSFLKSSSDFGIEERISFLPLITEIFEEGTSNSNVNFEFLKEKAYSKVDANYLLRVRKEVNGKPCFLNFFIKKDKYSDYYIPISFFPHKENRYEKNLQRLTLLYKCQNAEAVEKKELYKHQNFSLDSLE